MKEPNEKPTETKPKKDRKPREERTTRPLDPVIAAERAHAASKKKEASTVKKFDRANDALKKAESAMVAARQSEGEARAKLRSLLEAKLSATLPA